MTPEIPFWFKLAFTAFVAVLVPVYALRAAAGPTNFLWFSDIALFGACAALWLESSLLASTMAVGVLLLEAAWNVSFFGRLLVGRPCGGLADYMFDPKEHWYMRALSLFHVFMPATLLWLVALLSYDDRALLAQTLVAWIVLPVSFLITDPQHNINRVFGFSRHPQQRKRSVSHLALLMLGMPIVIYLPTHLLLDALFAR